MIVDENGLEYDGAWLGTDGTLYPCDYRFHYDFAKIICHNILRLEEFYDPEQKLEELGFVKITRWLSKDGAFTWLFTKAHCTKAQTEKLLDLSHLPFKKIDFYRLLRECDYHDLLDKAVEKGIYKDGKLLKGVEE